uniref:F-box domain-containing protein n=1 Tax=Steinernema glaseri TaxID=37863 RepID=A0A1I7ZRQ1_9BILA
MENVPYTFMSEVISLVDISQLHHNRSLLPFLKLSGQWRHVAEKVDIMTETSLYFKTLPSTNDVVFAFEENSLWEALKNNQPSRYYVNEIQLSTSRPYMRRRRGLKYHPLNAENTELLRRYLKKNTFPVGLYLCSDWTSEMDPPCGLRLVMEALRPLLLSIPRLSELCHDLGKHNPSGVELFRQAVRRGTLTEYVVLRSEAAFDEDYANLVREFIALRTFRRCNHKIPDLSEDNGSFLTELIEAWIAREDFDQYILTVQYRHLPLVKKFMSENGFRWEERRRIESLRLEEGIFRKESRNVWVSGKFDDFDSCDLEKIIFRPSLL